MSLHHAPQQGRGMNTPTKENLIKYILIANMLLSFWVMAYAVFTALGTGLILGGIMFNLSVVAFFVHRSGRVILGLVGKDLPNS